MRCAENTRMRGAKTEPAQCAEPNIPVHIKHAAPNVGGWVVGGVRVVAGGRMGGGWVDWWAVGVLWLGRWVGRWLVRGCVCCWWMKCGWWVSGHHPTPTHQPTNPMWGWRWPLR
jgi:hypothetical protein